MVGQEPITRTLKNALVSGRVAHAYLFTGPRGVGKTTTARLLAKALCCTARAGAEACGACPSCQDFVSGAHRSAQLLISHHPAAAAAAAATAAVTAAAGLALASRGRRR